MTEIFENLIEKKYRVAFWEFSGEEYKDDEEEKTNIRAEYEEDYVNKAGDV